jgi:hypothetical protein
MTVNELIEQLKNYPADMRVLTLGYEGGFDDIGLRTDDIVFNANSKDTWYYGSHETVNFMDNLPNADSQWEKHELDSDKCVIITRGR